MKKTVLFLFLSLVMVGCKKNNDHKVSKEDDPKKNGMKDFVAPMVGDLQYLCCKYNDYSVIEKYHAINRAEYETYLTDYWGSLANAQFQEVKWEAIKKLIDTIPCDEKYLSFEECDLNQNSTLKKADDISIKLVNTFGTKIACFSIPFLRSIEQNHQLDPKQIVKFTKATIDSDVKIVFTIEGKNFTGYYDISLDPTFL